MADEDPAEIANTVAAKVARLGCMRGAFAHQAVIELARDADLQQPGAVITVELCGHWEHPPPCPLAAHHTEASRDGERVRLRVLFATEPEQEKSVRDRIDSALAARWVVASSGPASVSAAEADHAERLIRS